MDKSSALKAPTAPPTADILDDFRKAMSGVLDIVSLHDLAQIKAFAEREDTPNSLSMVALACLLELEERGKREAKEEEDASHGTKRALTSVEAPGVRRGATQANDISDSLLELGERMDADRAVDDSGFKEGEKVIRFDLTLKEALVQTTWNIGAMLLISAVLCVVTAGLIYVLRTVLQGVSIRDAAVLQFGSNSTIEDYSRVDFVDTYSDERERRTKQFLSIVCAFSCASAYAFLLFGMLFGLGKSVPLVYYSKIFLLMAIPAFLPTVYYACGGKSLGSGVLIVIMCAFIGACTALIPDLAGKGIGDLMQLAVKSTRDKVASDNNGEMVKVKTKKTKKQRLKSAVIIALPALFTCLMIVVYTSLIFALYNAYDNDAWKAAISVLALLVKVIGNKVEIKLLKIIDDRIADLIDIDDLDVLPVWTADCMLFAYEFATALLCRVLQLSIPSQHVAQLTSLFGCILEMSVRIFFFNNYLKDALRKGEKWTEEEKVAYRKSGMLRAQDGNNDMVVEYVSSAAAVAILIFAVPTGALNLKAGQTVDRSQIFSVVLFQVGPEVILDFYCVFMEVFGGLGVFHSKYWSLSTGARTTEGRWSYFGNLLKSFVTKIFQTLLLSCLILLSIIK
ncbi:hypothetical protein TrCOL_g10621 [Triparma columacea]|uniref:Transmembrane protein n=1 Tax=Triparma columacea TaxID=722753 RepID=A0A9W7GGQ2_9STRA|nr:hypothetical protein TrCOL_g10621 [Triparma columacea]